MFHMMRNGLKDGTSSSYAIEVIRRRLPPGWAIEQRVTKQASVARLSSPDKSKVDFLLAARNGLLPRDVPALIASLSVPLLVLAAYLGPRTRELLSQAGVSYADATGNLRVVASSPAVFLEVAGAEQDPERTPRALQSLRGAAAGRVVRALVELNLPAGVRALAAEADTPLGTVSRVVTLLEQEALLTRDEKKRVLTVAWSEVLARWAKDYGLTKSNELHTFLDPRGLSSLWSRVKRLPRYAVTGSPAGPGIAPTRIAMIYVDDPASAAQTLNLVPADAGANVWLLRPYDDVVFARTKKRAIPAGDATVDVLTVSDAQAVVDLMSSPGRGPQEAEALIEQMKKNRRGT